MELFYADRGDVIDLATECAASGSTTERASLSEEWLIDAVVEERARCNALRRAEAGRARSARIIDDAIEAILRAGEPRQRPRPSYDYGDADEADEGVGPVGRRGRAPTRPRAAATDPVVLAARREAKRARDRAYQRTRRERMRAQRLAVVEEGGEFSEAAPVGDAAAMEIDVAREEMSLSPEEEAAAGAGVAAADAADADDARSEERRCGVECPVCFAGPETRQFSSLACGHIFCSKCISRALAAKMFCPTCRARARPSDVRRIFI